MFVLLKFKIVFATLFDIMHKDFLYLQYLYQTFAYGEITIKSSNFGKLGKP